MAGFPAVRGSIALLLGLALSIDPAWSAVRVCGEFIASRGEAKTEKEAKTKAMGGWMKKVAALGIERVRWQMAADRSLTCAGISGGYRCHALARPCVIKQVAPKGWVPEGKRDERRV
jgi:hypothetical protein